MKQLVLVFGGTSEAHQLVRILKEKNIPLLLCVATAYGGALVEDEGVKVHVGRLTADEMAALICRTGASQVVDATHPYAVQASENIKAPCLQAKVPCCRLKRAESTLQGCIQFLPCKRRLSMFPRLKGTFWQQPAASSWKNTAR